MAAASASASSASAAAAAEPVFEVPKSIARLDGLASVLAELPERFDFPASEEEIMVLWKALDAFKKQLEYSKDRPEFTFYDGPPFATGEHALWPDSSHADIASSARPRPRRGCTPSPSSRENCSCVVEIARARIVAASHLAGAHVLADCLPRRAGPVAAPVVVLTRRVCCSG
jgi:hypothetical protein